MNDSSTRQQMGRLATVLITAIVVVSIMTCVSAGAYPQGMVSYWKFDEGVWGTAYDSVGGNDGILMFDAAWTTDGIVNGAIDFDGVGDHVTCGNIAESEGPNATFEAWIRPQNVDVDSDHTISVNQTQRTTRLAGC